MGEAAGSSHVGLSEGVIECGELLGLFELRFA